MAGVNPDGGGAHLENFSDPHSLPAGPGARPGSSSLQGRPICRELHRAVEQGGAPASSRLDDDLLLVKAEAEIARSFFEQEKLGALARCIAETTDLESSI